MSKKLPTWYLSDHWAVGRNNYNWILYRRGVDEVGDPTKWKPAGYYRDPQLLLESLHRQVLRTTPAHFDLLHHLEVCVDRAKTLTVQLYSQIHSSSLVGVETASDQHNAEVI
jgi:hypothetical protein